VNRVSVSECAECGADLIAPERSGYASDHCVRNFWSCEVCGHRFEDTVYFPAPELAVSKQSVTEKRQREGGACMLQ
jgi:ribosomal protein L37AE/L43A